MKKLGFCFLIYDIINLEDLWYSFFKNIDKNKYNIYIHYKFDIQLKFFNQYKLQNCIKTNYADISLIHAHNLLFKTAYDDGCDKIISLSQACIPLKSFNFIYDFLTKDDLCHFNEYPHEYCFPRCNNLLKFYDRNVIRKSSNWFILNRYVCNLVTSYDKFKIIKEYHKTISPEEHYYITLIYKHNLQNQVKFTFNESNNATTFTNWPGSGYKYPSEHGLKNYSSISREELNFLIKSKCLFGRKFNKNCIIE